MDCASAAKLFLILCLHWPSLSSERLSCSWHTLWSRIPPADSLRFYWGLAPPASLCYHCCHPDNTELSAHVPVKCLWVDGESTAHLWSELLNCLLPFHFVSSWSLLVVFFFSFLLELQVLCWLDREWVGSLILSLIFVECLSYSSFNWCWLWAYCIFPYV